MPNQTQIIEDSPIALIAGIDNFLSSKLEEKLHQLNMQVYFVDDKAPDWLASVSQLPSTNINYLITLPSITNQNNHKQQKSLIKFAKDNKIKIVSILYDNQIGGEYESILVDEYNSYSAIKIIHLLDLVSKTSYSTSQNITNLIFPLDNQLTISKEDDLIYPISHTNAVSLIIKEIFTNANTPGVCIKGKESISQINLALLSKKILQSKNIHSELDIRPKIIAKSAFSCKFPKKQQTIDIIVQDALKTYSTKSARKTNHQVSVSGKHNLLVNNSQSNKSYLVEVVEEELLESKDSEYITKLITNTNQNKSLFPTITAEIEIEKPQSNINHQKKENLHKLSHKNDKNNNPEIVAKKHSSKVATRINNDKKLDIVIKEKDQKEILKKSPILIQAPVTKKNNTNSSTTKKTQLKKTKEIPKISVFNHAADNFSQDKYKIPTISSKNEKTINQAPFSSWKNDTSKKIHSPTLKIPRIKKNRKKSYTKILVVAVSVLGFIFLIISALLLPAGLMYFSTSNIAQNEGVDQAKIKSQLEYNHQLSYVSKDIYNSVSGELSPKINVWFDSLLRQLDYVANIAAKTKLVNIKSHKALSRLLSTESGDVFEQISEIKSDLDQIYYHLSQSEAVFSSGINPLLDKFNSYIGQENYKSFKQSNNISRQVVANLPQLLGKDKKVEYAIILQNNLELRPTGGFLSSVAFISFEKGKITNFEVKDVYQIDSNLNGTVDPPPEIKKYLGESSWYLRDANWDPDFKTSSKNIQWFLEKELNRQVDGVIGINLYSLKDMLEAVGEIELENGSLINASNIIDQAYHYQDVDLSSGSKKEFLSQVLKEIYVKLKSENESKTYLSFINSLSIGINSGQIKFQINNNNLNRLFSSIKASGEIINPLCPVKIAATSNSCTVDSFHINESNVGINKTNYHISRKQNHVINLTNQKITHSHTLTLKNNASNREWPAGNYKSFIRAYTPSNSKFDRVKINGEILSSDQYTTSSEHSKSMIGFYIEVPIGESLEIEITYQNNFSFDLDNTGAYAILFQKQPGTYQDPLSLKIIYPQEAQPVTISHSQASIGSVISLDTKLESDLFFAVEFTQ